MKKSTMFNETYSSLKESYLILYKKLTAMKEKNEQLKQRVKELESNNQRTITKEDCQIS